MVGSTTAQMLALAAPAGALAAAFCVVTRGTMPVSELSSAAPELYRVPSVGEDPTMCHTLPRMQAGKLHDLEMSYLSWRDVRPYHLPGCTCSVCHPETPGGMHSKSPRPMEARSDALVPLVARTTSEIVDRQSADVQKISSDYFYSKIQPSAFGFRPYGDTPGRPFKVYAGFHMTRQARLWRSKTLERVIGEAGRRPVSVPAEPGVTFDTIFAMMEGLGATVYVYGGVLRDVIMKGEHVADDIDVLFSCTVQQLVHACEVRGWVEGVDFHLKRDEKTGQKRYDYISVGEGKAKFSGHTLDSNCAGEFACNCMLFDVQRNFLIDASGWGIQDAAWHFLRIPYDGGHIGADGKTQWELWSENCDRMKGMISLRFLNFRSRGCEFIQSRTVCLHSVAVVA